MRKRLTAYTYRLSMGFVLCLSPIAADAGQSLYQDRDVSVEASLTLGAAAVGTTNTNFGAGLPTPGGRSLSDESWFEGFALPMVTADIGSDIGRLFAGVSAIGALTRGDSDASGGTFGRPEKTELEHLYVGWASGESWPSLGQDALSISVGAQDFEIGDGFLVSDGRGDGGDEGALYLGPRNTFRNSLLLQTDIAPVHGDLFYLDTRADQGGAQLVGANLEWRDQARGVVGGTVLHIVDVDQAGFETRDGLMVASLRGQGTPFSGARDWRAPLFLSFETAWQQNDGANRQAEAFAWYAEAGYHFDNLPWRPSVGYRYSFFSGDDLTTADNESFDPLFVGAPRGWGTWFQGEITGQYLFNHSNLAVHMARLDLTPHDDVALHALWFDFRFDEPATAGAVSDDLGHELNLIIDWAVTESLEVSGVFAVAFPGRGGAQAFGDDDPFHLFLLTGFANF